MGRRGVWERVLCVDMKRSITEGHVYGRPNGSLLQSHFNSAEYPRLLACILSYDCSVAEDVYLVITQNGTLGEWETLEPMLAQSILKRVR